MTILEHAILQIGPIPRRILLLGCAGAGKTTLAARLGEAIGAPVICLDAIWRPGRSEADIPGFRAQMAEMHAGPAWVSDGNFAQATFDLRLPRAQLVIWLDTPRPVCVWRALIRPFRQGEPHRPGDLGKVLHFIWNFDRVNRPRIERLRLEHGPGIPVLRLRSRADVMRFVAQSKAGLGVEA